MDLRGRNPLGRERRGGGRGRSLLLQFVDFLLMGRRGGGEKSRRGEGRRAGKESKGTGRINSVCIHLSKFSFSKNRNEREIKGKTLRQ